MWTRRLLCPHCHGEFDYEFVPGGSLTAVRLGTSRYMRCPLCHRFGMFRLFGSKTDAGGSATGATTPPSRGADTGGTGGALRPEAVQASPRFSDRRSLVRWSALLIVPATVLILSGVLFHLPTATELVLAGAGAVVLCVGAALLIGFSLPDRVP
ncbi:MAG: hypothetical protein WBW47_04570 [Thermoplasmata archaeon]